MSLGFKAAGARTIGAVELDATASTTFADTFATDNPVLFTGPNRGDVNQLDVEELLSALPSAPDLVIGGPPCQGFSRIGRAKHASLLGEEERIRSGGVRDTGQNLLYQYFLDVVRISRPFAFVMENVPGMRELMGNDFARRIAREAHSIGYNVRYFMLNAASYGVPQNRWRLFFVGLRADLGINTIPEPPKRTHLGQLKPTLAPLPEDDWLLAGGAIPTIDHPQPAVTVRDALGDLPKLKSHLLGEKPIEQRLPLRRQPSTYVQLLRDWPNHKAGETVSGSWYRFLGGLTGRQDHRIFERMAQGDKYPDAIAIAHQLFTEHWEAMDSPPEPGTHEWETLKAKFVPGYRNDAFDDKWRKLVADEPSWTLTAHLSKDSYSHIHYDSRQARTITVREAARLQSFPDSIEFKGPYGDRFRQIGNAVPPLLARAIASQLFAQLRAFGT